MEMKKSDNTYLVEILSQDQLEKAQQDLEFISLFTQAAKNSGMRVIIHGGYSVDGALGKITKPHKDIDIQVYSNSGDGKGVLLNLLNSLPTDQFDSEGINMRDKGRSTFYHNFLAVKARFCADFYYIQVDDNPFDKNKTIIKHGGGKNEIQEYRTHQVILNEVSFEATLPDDELNDKKSKKSKGEKHRADIDQDITNLEKLLQK